MDIILTQIAVLMILAVIGYVAYRTGYLPQQTGTYLSKLVIRVTAPALIFTAMVTYEFTPQTMKDGLWVSFFALVFMFFGLLMAVMLSRIFKIEGASANVFRAHVMLGNVGYLGMPLLGSLFGPKGLVYATFFEVALELLIWTLGVYLLNRHNNVDWRDSLKNLINPSIIAFVTGIILALVDIHHITELHPVAAAVYDLVYKILNPFASVNLYLVMLVIGMNLAENGIGTISEILTKRRTFGVSFLKLIVLPAVALAVLGFVVRGIDPFVKTVVIMELAMPCASIIPVLSVQFGSDSKLATENVVYSTIFSMFTLPVFLYILNLFL